MRLIYLLDIYVCITLSLFGVTDCFLRPFSLRVRKMNMCSAGFDQTPRSHAPLRHDACKLLISGVVGTEPKEIYLKSGHYVVNFALAVVGHYKAIHQQELYKPAETMWLSVEMWDELAKKNYAEIKKGRPVRGMGYIIQNKWMDKDTGEERKMYKVRITKVLDLEEFDTVHELLEDSDGTRQAGGFTPSTDSGFASDFPDPEDQSTVRGGKPASSEVATTSSYGYSYKKRSSPPAPQAAPPPQKASSAPAYTEPAQVPPPGSGNGQRVWESLKNSYPGMIKSDDKISGNTRPVDNGPVWG